MVTTLGQVMTMLVSPSHRIFAATRFQDRVLRSCLRKSRVRPRRATAANMAVAGIIAVRPVPTPLATTYTSPGITQGDH
jgi:hypothetical protein